MRFKELSDTDKDYLSTIYRQAGVSHEEKMSILAKKFGVSPRTIRTWAVKIGVGSNSSEARMSKQLKDARAREVNPKSKILLVTAAQNKTAVNTAFMQSLLNYKDYLEEQGYPTEIVIIPIKYRNPTSITEHANTKGNDWWVDEVEPYLHYNKIYFGDTLVSANSRVVPTASMPLNGYEALASENNLVIGHPRIHFKTLPRFKGNPLRTMNTTGFCTYKHYSLSKSGDKGGIHHTYGFTIIEKDGDKTHVPRTVKAGGDGSFTDINVHVTPEGANKVNTCKGIVLGDIHHAHLNQDFWGVTKELLGEIIPSQVVLHDLLDAETVNRHQSHDMFIRKRMIVEGRYLIQDELDSTMGFVKELQDSQLSVKVIQSNHDDFLDQHINSPSVNWKKDLHNSEAYLRLAMIQQTVDLRETGNIFGHLLSEQGVDYIRSDQNFGISGYEVGSHGDNGINGARGSINSFKRLNIKMIHGHSHSPSIIDNVTCVGVSCDLWQYYNSAGLSSWAHAHSIIHDSGKNQLLVYNDDYKISNLI